MTQTNTTQEAAPATEKNFTPREVVSELDKYIVGQEDAKRAVAVALRNRWRRKLVPGPLRDEIAPKNIILIGATGVGKSEIARRLAKLAQAPFVKVEASKFTEVGYVGRDVDSMVRDLVESAVTLVRAEEREKVQIKAQAAAEERILDILLPPSPSPAATKATPPSAEPPARAASGAAASPAAGAAPTSREKWRKKLRAGELQQMEVEVDAPDKHIPPQFQMLSGPGFDDVSKQFQDAVGHILGQRTRRRKVTVEEAMQIFCQQEANKLIDEDYTIREGIRRAEESGIIFLDEIDKIARRPGGNSQGPDVSREGVQRDILPVVEGAQINTKYGMVNTTHVLFIAAGAFHVSKISDLIPELQGRFPIRVQLSDLDESQLLRILKEPKNALPTQYQALLATEGVTLAFTEEALAAIAAIAALANARSENIGARRLHTVFERLLEEISFSASERAGQTVTVDAPMVNARLGELAQQADLSRYIL